MQSGVIGVEIGGTKQQLAIGNQQGELLHVMCGKVIRSEGSRGILAWMEKEVPNMLKLAREQYGLSIAGIGVGFGGPLETQTGRVLCSVHIDGWKDVELREWFEARFGIPATICNDTSTACLGEYVKGSGRGTQQFVYTNIGSGIGGGFIIDGKLYDAQGFGAAELGQTYIPDWTAKQPGQERRLEQLCSGWAIEERLREPGYIDTSSRMLEMVDGDVKRVDCLTLARAAKLGDVFALKEIDRIAQGMGIALCNVLALVQPQRIAVGGGVSNMGDLLLEPLRKHVEKRVFISNIDHYEIVPCILGETIVLDGAVILALEMLQAMQLNGR